jgi:hypothetical protein
LQKSTDESLVGEEGDQNHALACKFRLGARLRQNFEGISHDSQATAANPLEGPCISHRWTVERQHRIRERKLTGDSIRPPSDESRLPLEAPSKSDALLMGRPQPWPGSIHKLIGSSDYQAHQIQEWTRDIYGAIFEPRDSVVVRRLALGESVPNSPVPPNWDWGNRGDLTRLFSGTAFVKSPVIGRVPRIYNVI